MCLWYGSHCHFLKIRSKVKCLKTTWVPFPCSFMGPSPEHRMRSRERGCSFWKLALGVLTILLVQSMCALDSENAAFVINKNLLYLIVPERYVYKHSPVLCSHPSWAQLYFKEQDTEFREIANIYHCETVASLAAIGMYGFNFCFSHD